MFLFITGNDNRKQRSQTVLLCWFSTWPEHAAIHAFGELMLPWGSN